MRWPTSPACRCAKLSPARNSSPISRSIWARSFSTTSERGSRDNARNRSKVRALAILFVASIWAGAQNALAGGGSFITLPSLMLTGMDARAANITSTVALFPAQLVTGFTGRSDAMSPPGLPMRTLIVISLIGGALGALILLWIPPTVFARLVPWLVLFAAALFVWGSFFRRLPQPGEAHLPPWGAAIVQFFIAIYGGYFGGGIGLLMMASLAMGGLAVRNAGASKNILAGVMNASAVAIFALSSDVHWDPGHSHRRRRLNRRLGRRDDAEDRQREALESGRDRDRRAADDWAFLERPLGVCGIGEFQCSDETLET